MPVIYTGIAFAADWRNFKIDFGKTEDIQNTLVESQMILVVRTFTNEV